MSEYQSPEQPSSDVVLPITGPLNPGDRVDFQNAVDTLKAEPSSANIAKYTKELGDFWAGELESNPNVNTSIAEFIARNPVFLLDEVGPIGFKSFSDSAKAHFKRAGIDIHAALGLEEESEEQFAYEYNYARKGAQALQRVLYSDDFDTKSDFIKFTLASSLVQLTEAFYEVVSTGEDDVGSLSKHYPYLAGNIIGSTVSLVRPK